MVARLVMVALLVTTGAACKHNKHANTTVRSRAMFDFACPEDELTLRVVDVEGARKLSSQIAVYGCDKKAVYVYVPDIDTWVINGAVSEMPADFDIAPNVTKGKGKSRDDKKASKAEKKGKMGPVEAAPAEAVPAAAMPVEAAPIEAAPVETAPEPVPDPS